MVKVQVGAAYWTVFPPSLACSEVVKAFNEAVYQSYGPSSTGQIRANGCSADPVAANSVIYTVTPTGSGANTVLQASMSDAVSVTEWPLQSMLMVVAIVFALLMGFRTGYRA